MYVVHRLSYIVHTVCTPLPNWWADLVIPDRELCLHWLKLVGGRTLRFGRLGIFQGYCSFSAELRVLTHLWTTDLNSVVR